ncbi:MAG: hypothetical protein GOMPHAMPRED_007960 [Gomphillus americanus]|uniref:J domain-containing protein n=1 Tax=Gomphillus americanus TaxID=1940652 RepID=A0A8H3EVT4_9LECA|nr:MAG: hypothetical protein GOMPHAMPRED_007960 [Gomphillus americanus]
MNVWKEAVITECWNARIQEFFGKNASVLARALRANETLKFCVLIGRAPIIIRAVMQYEECNFGKPCHDVIDWTRKFEPDIYIVSTMLKPSKTLLSSGGGLQHLWTATSPITTSSGYTGQPRQRYLQTQNSAQSKRQWQDARYPCRCQCLESNSNRRVKQIRMAHTSSSPPLPDHDPESYWPTLSPNQQPTPYDILSHPISGPYNKRRFTYLVKLYHPDSCATSGEQVGQPTSKTHPSVLPPQIRLRRYHLLIQAHSILSSPDRRAAYDRHGAGWASIPSLEDLRRENTARGWAAARDHQAGSPSHCATWEDWEEWWDRQVQRQRREDENIFAHDFTRYNETASERAERQAWWVAWIHARRHWPGYYPPASERQRTIYVSNGLFVLLIVSFTIGGAMYELSRAGRSSSSFMAQLERANQESWEDLSRRRKESREFENRGERVGRFLKERGDDRVFGGKIYEKASTDGEANT